MASLEDYQVRVQRVIALRNRCKGWLLIWLALSFIATSLYLIVIEYRPDCGWYIALPLVYWLFTLRQYVIWSSV